MAADELLAPVPKAKDYSVSADLWERLEEEIQNVADRIKNGDELVPEDVKNIKKLKKQVDTYLADFNHAMRDAQAKYKKMVDGRLNDLGFNDIESFIQKKRREQSDTQNSRIKYKMDCLKEISDSLLARTERLKDIPMANELLPAFTARFPKVQSGAKDKDITDWKPYFAVIHQTVMTIDTFFRDPKYEEAVLLPVHSGTIRELLAYARDGKKEHLTNVPVRFVEDRPLVEMEKLRQRLISKSAGIEHIKQILEDLDDMDGLTDSVKQARTEQAWDRISQIVRLCNTM